MRRLACPITLLLGFAPIAFADAGISASAAPVTLASAPLAATRAPGNEPVPAYLTREFGVAQRKAEQISSAVSLAAAKYALPPAVLLAIISIESRFREKARGANGATGLMQVVPSVHRDLVRHVKDLTEPATNIDVGAAILYGYMQAANGDLDTAMRRYGGSQAYAQKIRLRAETFRRAIGTNAQPETDIAPSTNARSD